MATRFSTDQIPLEAPQISVTNLSSVDILALKATPIEVASAPGEGKMIVPYLIILTLDNAGETPYNVSGGSSLNILWGSNDIYSGGLIGDESVFAQVAKAYTVFTTNAIIGDATFLDASLTEGQPLMLQNSGAGEYTTGTGTAKITVYYNIVSVS